VTRLRLIMQDGRIRIRVGALNERAADLEIHLLSCKCSAGVQPRRQRLDPP